MPLPWYPNHRAPAPESTSVLASSLASSTPICVSDDSFPCNRITLFNTILSDVVLTELVYIFSNLRLLRNITAGDKVEFFYTWRKDGDKGVAVVWLLVLT